MLTEQTRFLARIRPDSERAGLALPAVVALAVVGSAIIGLHSPDVSAIVPVGGLLVAIACVHICFKRPIYIFLLLIRNARRPGRPLVWVSQGKLTVLDARLFSEPLADVRLELSDHDGGRVTYFQFIGNNDRATIWNGYFEPSAEEFMADLRALQSSGGQPDISQNLKN